MTTHLRIRSFLMRHPHSLDPGAEAQFVLDVLSVLPGSLDLGAVKQLRKTPDLSPEEILQKRRSHGVVCIDGRSLAQMQMATRPISDRHFCLSALAFVMDLGVDLHGPRIQAIGLALHPRIGEGSNMSRLSGDIVGLIARLSCE